jgi:glucosyl-3-phosphoglycerate phosphatase
VLWRHGQTTWNVERRFQGQSDVPLNEVGVEQAREAARLLAAVKPAAIFASDLSRAARTAGELSRLTGLPVQFDKDLRERNGGKWEGLSDREIREQYPEAHRAWMPPDGESVQAVGERAAGAFERIAEGLPSDSVGVIVSHGAAIGLGLAQLLGLPLQDRVLGALSNCCWSVVGQRGGRWRLLEHNVGRLPVPVPDVAVEAGGEVSAGEVF